MSTGVLTQPRMQDLLEQLRHKQQDEDERIQKERSDEAIARGREREQEARRVREIEEHLSWLQARSSQVEPERQRLQRQIEMKQTEWTERETSLRRELEELRNNTGKSKDPRVQRLGENIAQMMGLLKLRQAYDKWLAFVDAKKEERRTDQVEKELQKYYYHWARFIVAAKERQLNERMADLQRVKEDNRAAMKERDMFAEHLREEFERTRGEARAHTELGQDQLSQSEREREMLKDQLLALVTENEQLKATYTAAAGAPPPIAAPIPLPLPHVPPPMDVRYPSPPIPVPPPMGLPHPPPPPPPGCPPLGPPASPRIEEREEFRTRTEVIRAQ